MSIKDDLLEEHLLEMNVCFVCDLLNDENGNCPTCSDPNTYFCEKCGKSLIGSTFENCKLCKESHA